MARGIASWEQRQSSDLQNLVSQRGAEIFKLGCFLSLQILYSKGNILILYRYSDKPLHRATLRYNDATSLSGDRRYVSG